MKKTVLITGGFGFLGRATAQRFKQSGYHVVGIGNGRWESDQFTAYGFDAWLESRVTLSSLVTLDQTFDVVVHCAGNGSVGFAQEHPRQDFEKTVVSAADLLEFVRLHSPDARVIYPSSAGVYGAKPDAPIKESDPQNPVSTYGHHKRIVEELCENYSRSYALSIGIVRLFSVYGEGLSKQLLWDASVKLSASEGHATFWGSGEETRDWIHAEDAAAIILRLAEMKEPLTIVNGAAGERVTVREVIERLAKALDAKVDIRFNGLARAGDPRFYHADVSRLRDLGLLPTVTLADGVDRYARWFQGAWSG